MKNNITQKELLNKGFERFKYAGTYLFVGTAEIYIDRGDDDIIKFHDGGQFIRFIMSQRDITVFFKGELDMIRMGDDTDFKIAIISERFQLGENNLDEVFGALAKAIQSQTVAIGEMSKAIELNTNLLNSISADIGVISANAVECCKKTNANLEAIKQAIEDKECGGGTPPDNGNGNENENVGENGNGDTPSDECKEINFEILSSDGVRYDDVVNYAYDMQSKGLPVVPFQFSVQSDYDNDKLFLYKNGANTRQLAHGYVIQNIEELGNGDSFKVGYKPNIEVSPTCWSNEIYMGWEGATPSDPMEGDFTIDRIVESDDGVSFYVNVQGGFVNINFTHKLNYLGALDAKYALIFNGETVRGQVAAIEQLNGTVYTLSEGEYRFELEWSARGEVAYEISMVNREGQEYRAVSVTF